MPSTEADAATYATTSTTDFYTLLSIPTTETSPSALRKAFRQQSLKWHPDKNPDPAAAETFHLLTVAYDVLSDPGTRAAYDAARNARLARKRRTEAFDVDRRRMKEDLGEPRARREKGTHRVEEAEEAYAGSGAAAARRRRRPAGRGAAGGGRDDGVADLGAVFALRGGAGCCCAAADGATGGEKEKKFRTALVVFVSIVSAHAAVCEASSGGRGGELAVFRDVTWASGKEPDLTHEVGKGRSEVPEAKAGPSITLMRMRAAEKARIEAEIRRQDEEAEAAGAEAEALS
ncbi:uncharacterized protein LAJ45_11270 [Morchella importuna]|uniref:uncharacterized protein n=1 Tax=Morchella importuna TaxID=1174673 RepID=UPI001E8E6E5A|nr:uncharacterized protein LAJ45_11270 [Morchella importuna]KAH8144677.1 hypothetical protein LAJ45_11270 [Morchella importuna]